MLYYRPMRSLPRLAITLPVLHVFFSVVTLALYAISPQPLLEGPARFTFYILWVADFPISAMAFGAMYVSQHDAPYAAAGWAVVGTLWWYCIGVVLGAIHEHRQNRRATKLRSV